MFKQVKTIKEACKTFHKNSQKEDNNTLLPLLKKIQTDIIKKGDAAVISYTQKFDKLTTKSFTLNVTKKEIKEAYNYVDTPTLKAMKAAIQNIKTYHKNQQPKNWKKTASNQTEYGVLFNPIKSVGLYVPGGRAPYPSTVIMSAIPAKMAEVPHIVLTTPPQPDGSITPTILVAADLCGIDTIIKAGGAQAIFALAHGTKSIPKVSKIVGPGNIYVDTAKQLVYGPTDIDKPAGPSDICVYIEDPKYAPFAASEMLAQLEHDPLALAITISTSQHCLDAVSLEATSQLKTLSRKTTIKQSATHAQLLLVTSQKEGIEAINALAPEHLSLLVDNDTPILKKITNAGSIFCGPYTPVTLGDYYAGPNHVLPTSGAAKFASPLGVMDFMKYSSYLRYNKPALKKAQPHLKMLTQIEGFDAHYNAVIQRIDKK